MGRGPHGRRPLLELEAIYAEVEEYLIRVRSHSKIRRTLSVKHDVGMRTVDKWIKVVHDRWRANSTEEDRDAKRNAMRATLDELLSQAMNRTEVVRGDDGKPVKNEDGTLMRRVRPDITKALHAAAQLRALDGLDAPLKITAKVTPGGEVKATVTLVTQSERDALVSALKGLPKREG